MLTEDNLIELAAVIRVATADLPEAERAPCIREACDRAARAIVRREISQESVLRKLMPAIPIDEAAAKESV